MGNLLKVLSFAVDIFKGVGSITKSIKKTDRKKKDEKEESELTDIINSK